MRSYLRAFLIGLILLMACASAASAATLHVGSGYTYSTPQAAITAASSGDTVYVHSGTYSVSTMITMKSGVSLVGDGVNKTIIKAASASAGNSSTYPALIYCSGASSLTIANMSVLGYYSDWTSQHSNAGHNDYGIGINIRGSSNNVVVHDVYMDMLTGDGIKVSGSTNTNLYNLKITTSGHDGVCFYSTSYGYLNNSYIDLAVNTGIRFDGASHCRVAQTTFIQSNSGTGAGYIELENTLTNCTVTKNAFLTSSDPVIWLASADGGTVSVTNNILYGVAALSSSYSPYTMTLSNNTRYTSSYDWADMGYGYNAASTGSGSLPIYNGSALPALTSPANGATLQTINGRQTFEWSDVNSTQYRVYVASDSGFTTIVSDTTTTSPSTSIALSNGTYYWRIKAYIDSNSTWSGNTSAWSFTISGNTLSKTGAYGVIYDTDTDNPIQGAVVTLMNVSWSETYVTGDDGYYSFSVSKDTANGSVYYLSAIATDYIGSYSAAGSGLPLNMTAETYEENIALTRSPTYINPHYVSFVVKAPWGTTYSNVSVSAYEGSSSTPKITGVTDDYGKVTMKLEEDVSYRITCVDEAQNINVERNVIPVDPVYEIFVYNGHKIGGIQSTTNTTPAKATDYIGYGHSVAEFNMSYGLINQTVLSKDNQTVTYTSKITQLYLENGTETGYYIEDVSGSTSSMDSWSTAVPVGYSYKVVTTVTHPSWTEKYQNTESVKGYTINPHFDFGWENQWNYEVMGYALVLFAAGLTSYASLPLGILSVLGISSLNLYIGWWQFDVTGQLMFTFAWLLGLGYILTKRT